MEINYIKLHGGVMVPDSEAEADRMKRFKNGETYKVNITLPRNTDFHRKALKFFRFCFNYWVGDHDGIQTGEKQFDYFRGELLKSAGYFHTVFNLDATFEIAPDSIKFENMDQDEFEQCYSALINAAMRTIFHPDDDQIFNELKSFF